LAIKEEKFKDELMKNRELIEKQLRNNRKSNEILNKAYNLSKQYFLKMKNEVEKYKQEFPYSKEAIEIEKKYDEALTSYINTTLEVIGG